MIGYILLIILVITSWVVFGFGAKKDNAVMSIISIFLGIVLTAMFVASTVYVASRSSDAVVFQGNRDYHQELVYSISDEMSPATITRIFSSAENINDRIESNKGGCDSQMWGFLYNKGIAEVEPIDIPKYKISVEVEK